MNDIIYREIPLPYRVGGFTALDANGDYNVYVNLLLSDEAKNKAYRHELSHINNLHFYGSQEAAECEKEAVSA